MGLLSRFKRERGRNATTAMTTGEPVDDVGRARTQARRRLTGAVVLVVIGIIGFPLVFETQPRPVSVDVPIEIPPKNTVPALVMPPAPTTDRGTGPVATEPAGLTGDIVITEMPDDAGREVVMPPSASGSGAASAALPARTAERAAARPAGRPGSDAGKAVATVDKPAADKSAADARIADSARVRAAVDARNAAASTPLSSAETKTDDDKTGASRFIVQVGAFAEAAAAREARLKAEKLGLKTYTQVAETAAGSRIRVRVGPFATRDDADKALAKARAAGLGGVVLTL